MFPYQMDSKCGKGGADSLDVNQQLQISYSDETSNEREGGHPTHDVMKVCIIWMWHFHDLSRYMYVNKAVSDK